MWPYLERFPQEALGHNSRRVYRIYTKRALMKIPSLEDYEERLKKYLNPLSDFLFNAEN
jgi:cob(I)alamin adenosyltransferase